jgi:hypothetical protein
MTPTAKPPGQSSAVEIMFNAGISFRRRVSSKDNRTPNCASFYHTLAKFTAIRRASSQSGSTWPKQTIGLNYQANLGVTSVVRLVDRLGRE